MYNIELIEKCHWSELLKVFSLPIEGDLDKDDLSLTKFLWSNVDNENSKYVASILRKFLLELADKTNSFENEIYRAIANTPNDFTVIKWFCTNTRSFYC